ncbi:hypothetical protein SDC9_94066 [bioreactor metagenome]|uniref:GGDEF domain-containing protein n=1 Tax=bioreactor metagenome TaxID=1076179 RepID=A0A645A2Q3_9ZZZZ|nr:diguanylate cyclase [Candidatus Metalachnospira sp.]
MPLVQSDYLVSGIINIVMLIMLAKLIYINKWLSPKIEQSYFIAIASTIILIIAEIATFVFDNSVIEYRKYSVLANVIGFSLSTTIPISMSIIFEARITQKIKKCLAIPTLINLIFVLLSPEFGYVFSITPENIYSRGPLFFVYAITYIWNCLILMAAIYKSVKESSSYDKCFLFSLFGLTIIGTSIQIIFPNLHTTWHCISIVLVLYYIFLCELQFKYDSTTKVMNRPTFDRAIYDLKESKNGAIVMFDVDQFKEINDKYGHQHGDYCLKEVANIIKKCFDKKGICYRIGGDEFCIISNTTDIKTIDTCINKVINQISILREKDVTIPFVSYGYSIYEYGGEKNIKEAIKIADDNMYSYKKMRNHRN